MSLTGSTRVTCSLTPGECLRPRPGESYGVPALGFTLNGWGDDATVYGPAPADALCARCDVPLPAGEQAASVPGLDARGWAHLTCVPRGGASDEQRQEHWTPELGDASGHPLPSLALE